MKKINTFLTYRTEKNSSLKYYLLYNINMLKGKIKNSNDYKYKN